MLHLAHFLYEKSSFLAFIICKLLKTSKKMKEKIKVKQNNLFINFYPYICNKLRLISSKTILFLEKEIYLVNLYKF